MDTFLLPYALTGALAGLLAGLMGVGGGLVIVPALLWLFAWQDFAPETLAHQAVASSLAAIIPIALASLWSHQRNKAIDWRAAGWLSPGLMGGALLGSWLATDIGSPLLQMLFGLFLLLVAWQMASGARPSSHASRPNKTLLGLFGGLIGAISALVGIGGGTMTVPLLIWQGAPLPRAIATSAACGLPIAIAGTLGFWWFGAHKLASQLVYWPAVIPIAVLAVATAPVGAHLAHHLPVARLRRIFALVILLAAARLLLGGLE